MYNLPDISQLTIEQIQVLLLEIFSLIKSQEEQIKLLQLENQKLKNQLALNSSNSSKPPSSDGLKKPQPKSLRVAGQRKSGGQFGHAGTTLEQVENPDIIIKHQPSGTCEKCGGAVLGEATFIGKRQVFDIPPIDFEVTEHQLFSAKCQCGHENCASYPENVSNNVQYGPRVSATVVFLTQHHMMPLKRTSQVIESFFGLKISEASIISCCQRAHEYLKSTVEQIGNFLLASKVVHADETGVRINGKPHWLHTLANEKFTWMDSHQKRGMDAISYFNLLTHFVGILVHDGWKPYRKLQCIHALCNAHHLRELVYLHEQMAQAWAGKLKALLQEACKICNESPDSVLTPEQYLQFRARYTEILDEGERLNPKEKSYGNKGKVAQSKATNLLTRLRDYAEDIWLFARDKDVPFTNNLAEQAIRMPKVKQKVSGCFRTFEGSKIFCTIRSYLSTLDKQSFNTFDALIKAFMGSPVQPRFEQSF